MLYEFTWGEGTGYLTSRYISGGMVIFLVLALFRERIQSRGIEQFQAARFLLSRVKVHSWKKMRVSFLETRSSPAMWEGWVF